MIDTIACWQVIIDILQYACIKQDVSVRGALLRMLEKLRHKLDLLFDVSVSVRDEEAHLRLESADLRLGPARAVRIHVARIPASRNCPGGLRPSQIRGLLGSIGGCVEVPFT